MHILKIFKSFIAGVFIGGLVYWLYQNTGFAKLLSDLEIIWAAIIGSVAWWFKVLFEKWDNDRKSIAKLERIVGLNYNTFLGTKKFLFEWRDHILNKKPYYHTHVETLQVPTEDILGNLRNLTVLNATVPWSLKNARYNNDLGYMWSQYEISRDNILKQTDIDISLNIVNSLLPAIKELLDALEMDLETTIKTAAILRAAVCKIDKSLFKKITQLTLYSISETEIEYEILQLRKEIKDKKLV